MTRRFFQFPWRPRRTIDADVDDELQFHLDVRTEELIALGMSRADARAQAASEFGDLDGTRVYLRQIDGKTENARRRRNYMQEFMQDIRYAFRSLGAAPAFAATAILTLTLAIGANTAVFSIVHAVLLQPLPFPHPDRLYAVYSTNRAGGQFQAPVSAVDLDDWRAQRRLIEEIGGYLYADGSTGVDLTGRGTPRRLNAVFVTPGFFGALNRSALAGRLPREDELVRGGPDKILMLTHGFWLREFGGSLDAVNSHLTINGAPYEIVGVLPADFRFPTDDADVYVPFSTIPDSGIPRVRAVRVLSVVARAKPDAPPAAIRAELDTIARRLAAEYPENRPWDTATVLPLHDVVTGQVRESLFVVLGAVGFVLLIACVNVSSLQLARAAARGREIAVRAALGAGRGRIVRQLLTESLVLAAIGGAFGVVLAAGLTSALLALATGQLPRAAEVRLDAMVMMFAAGASALTALLVGLVPAVRLTSTDLQKTLREGGRSLSGVENRRLRTALTVAEIALAVILVAGAGLMARSFVTLTRVDPGFRADHLIAVQFTIDPQRHSPDPAAPVSPFNVYYTQLIEKIRSMPGVISAAAVKDPPLRGNGERVGFGIADRPVPAGQDRPGAAAIHISDGYFATIGARMTDGREYTIRDNAAAPRVLVVNEAFARTFFPGERAVGKRLQAGPTTTIEIIGVVNDIRQLAMAEPAKPTIYIHNLQNARVKTTIVARTQGEPLAMANAIREAVWSLDPNQAITSVFTFDAAVSRALGRPRLVAVLLGAFGVLGLLLGVVGVYGLLAQLVSQRRRDIGVRMALGASPSDVRALFVGRGFKLALLGVAVGIAGALALCRALTSVLYGVSPGDPLTFVGTSALLLAAAVSASWLPAQRAARMDPAQTLRAE